MKQTLAVAIVGFLTLAVCCQALGAEKERSRGELRGSFLRTVGKEFEKRMHLAVQLKPVEGKSPETVLVPTWQKLEGEWVPKKDLVAMVLGLREGQKVRIAYVLDGGQRWAMRIEAGTRREGEGQRRPEAERGADRPREGRREGERAERRGEGERRDRPRREGERAERPREGARERAEGEGRDRPRREGEGQRRPEAERRADRPREGARERTQRERRDRPGPEGERAEGERRRRALEAENRELRELVRSLRGQVEAIQKQMADLRAQIRPKEQPTEP